MSRPEEAPPEPTHDAKPVWYRGWEISWDAESYHWTQIGWRAYKGGCDLGAQEVSGLCYADVLDEIDAEEDDV